MQMTNHDPGSRRWPMALFGASVAIGLICLTATYLIIYYGNAFGPVATRLLLLLNLSSENTAGVWWSGMMFATSALFCFDAHLIDKGTERHNAGRAWFAIGVALMVLSFDEIGSLHERLPQMFPSLGSTLALLPYAAVEGSLLAFGLLVLFLDRKTRWTAVAMGIPLAVLLSVPVQEKLFLETHSGWLSLHEAVRATLEEGIETVCELAILLVTLRNSVASRSASGASLTPAFDAPNATRRPLLAASLLLAPLAAYWNASLDDLQRGRPIGWLAAFLCVFAAIAYAHPFLKASRALSTRRRIMALICGVLSVEAVALNSSHTWVVTLIFGTTLLVSGTVKEADGRGPVPRVALVLAGFMVAGLAAAKAPTFALNLSMALGAWVAYFASDPVDIRTPTTA